jgi:hypothetical protein
MRRTLKICLLVAILSIAVAPVMAQVVWSGGVSITERTDLTAISSTCNASRYGRPVGATDTSMGLQAIATAHQSMAYEASLSTVGIPTDKIVDAILTPDGGVTAWSPKFIRGQGYTIALPLGNTMIDTRCKVLLPKKHTHDKDRWEERTLPISFAGLAPGKMAKLEWKLAVNDGRRTVSIVFIPLTFSFERKLSFGFSFMVQQALPDFDRIPNTIEGDHLAFAYLRGFVPAWASLDPAELLRQKMVNDIIGAQPQPVQPQSIQSQSQSRREEVTTPLPQGVNVVGQVRVEVGQPSATLQPVYAVVNICIWKGNEKQVWKNQNMCISAFANPLLIEFKRGNVVTSRGEAEYCENAKCIEIHLLPGYDFPSTSDRICSKEN